METELIRKINYYETDKMGIVHHSNYIRYFEEGRLHYLDEIGFGFAKMEEQGVICPVVSVSCEYKRPIRFGETVSVLVALSAYTGVTMAFSYRVVGQDGTLHATGESKHCFVNESGKPVSVKRAYPEIHEIMMENTAIAE